MRLGWASRPVAAWEHLRTARPSGGDLGGRAVYRGAVTTPSDDAAQPVPVRVVLPADPVLGHPEQEVVARLWRRRQTETGWLYLVGLPS